MSAGRVELGEISRFMADDHARLGALLARCTTTVDLAAYGDLRSGL